MFVAIGASEKQNVTQAEKQNNKKTKSITINKTAKIKAESTSLFEAHKHTQCSAVLLKSCVAKEFLRVDLVLEFATASTMGRGWMERIGVEGGIARNNIATVAAKAPA